MHTCEHTDTYTQVFRLNIGGARKHVQDTAIASLVTAPQLPDFLGGQNGGKFPANRDLLHGGEFDFSVSGSYNDADNGRRLPRVHTHEDQELGIALTRLYRQVL